MKTKSQKLQLGIFIIAGIAIFTIAIVIIGSKENMFTETFTLNSVFDKVSGLRTGSIVRFNGISVGKVDKMDLNENGSIIVKMSIDEEVQEFIKKDSKASIISEGLVGNKIVEIVNGTVTANSVEDGDLLVSILPLDTEDIFRNLESSTSKADQIAQNIIGITEKINEGQGTLGRLISNDEIARNLDLMSRNLYTSSGNFNNFSLKLNGTVDNLNGTVSNVSGDLAILSGNLKKIANDIELMIARMQNGQGIAGTLISDTVAGNNIKQFINNLNSSSKNIEQGTYSFSENMEALKHNFLFSGYYEDIGYWDKNKKVRKENELEQKARELRIKEQQLEEREKRLREIELKNNIGAQNNP